MRADIKRLCTLCDTNVLLSMLGLPGRRLQVLWEIIREGGVELFISDFILEELSRNLKRKIGLVQEDIESIFDTLRQHAHVVTPKEKVALIQEKESDNRILEAALTARVDFLITGNFKHIRPLGTFQGIEILTPREFLEKYFPSR